MAKGYIQIHRGRAERGWEDLASVFRGPTEVTFTEDRHNGHLCLHNAGDMTPRQQSVIETMRLTRG